MPRTTRLALVAVLMLMPAEASAPKPELVAGAGQAAGPVSLLVEGRRFRLADIEDGGWTLEACPALSLLAWGRRVECRTVGRRVDGEDEAVCTADGVDLALPLLARGLASTRPTADSLYRRIEGAAGALGYGIWDDQTHWPPW